MYLGYEEADLEQEEFKLEIIPCPFCGLEMDTMELCFHIDDEHPIQAKNGVFFLFLQLFKRGSHCTNED